MATRSADVARLSSTVDEASGRIEGSVLTPQVSRTGALLTIADRSLTGKRSSKEMR